MKLLLRSLLTSAFVAAFGAAHAWIDAGHMVVAAIAQRDLAPAVRAEVDRLVKVNATEKAFDFLTAACWADDTKTRENGGWHYEDHHFRTDGKPATGKPEPENAVWAIERFTKILGDRTKSDAERADALRFIIHFVGDIHQPLHATARDTDAEPTGDRGGNDFHILPPAELADMNRPPKQLHFLWDMGAGLFMPNPDIRKPEGERLIVAEADALRAALPRRSLTTVSVTDPEKWALESFDDSKKYVYATTENAAPTPEYMAAAREVVARRATLAGYRLADLLNRTLK